MRSVLPNTNTPARKHAHTFNSMQSKMINQHEALVCRSDMSVFWLPSENDGTTATATTSLPPLPGVCRHLSFTSRPVAPTLPPQTLSTPTTTVTASLYCISPHRCGRGLAAGLHGGCPPPWGCPRDDTASIQTLNVLCLKQRAKRHFSPSLSFHFPQPPLTEETRVHRPRRGQQHAQQG